MPTVETGLIRFTVPSNATDGSQYRFVLSSQQRLEVEPTYLPIGRPLRQAIAGRIDQAKFILPDLAHDSDITYREEQREIRGLEVLLAFTGIRLEATFLPQLWLVARTPEAGGAVFRYIMPPREVTQRPAADPIGELLISTLGRAEAGGALPQDVVRRSAVGITFGLPAEFTAPDHFTFFTTEWTIIVTHGDVRTSSWKEYAPNHRVDVIRRESEAVTLSRLRLSADETRTNVRFTPFAPAGGVAAEDHIVREVTISAVAGRTFHAFGASKVANAPALDEAWQTLIGSLEGGMER